MKRTPALMAFMFVVASTLGSVGTSQAEMPKSNTCMDCTIKVSFESNGTKVQGTVTFHDIPWYECVGIKIANFFN